MGEFKELTKELADRIGEIDYPGDLGDIGNEVGVIIAKYFKPDNDAKEEYGWGKDDFINGLNHGISLTDGTH